MEQAQPLYEFELSGGALCLDFTNTVSDRPRCNSEHLTGYNSFLEWARQAGLLNSDEANALGKLAKERPEETDSAFAGALRFRESLYRIFAAFSNEERPEDSDMNALNRHITAGMKHLYVGQQEKCCEWEWSDWGSRLDCPLWPVSRSAAELLTSDRVKDVRECDSEDCSWLFLDSSRSKRRRWCDMKTCGNRAKARRHYEKQKKEDTRQGRPTN